MVQAQARALLTLEHTVAELVTGAEDPADSYRQMLAAIGAALGWRAGAVWMPLLDGSGLQCAFTWTDFAADVQAFADLSRVTTLPTGAGLPGRVWASGEAIWLSDVRIETNYPRAAAAAAAGLSTALCFPVRGAAGMEACLEFYSDRPQAPDRGVLATMSSLGLRMGNALQLARAELGVRDRSARLRAVLDAALDCVVTMDAAGRIVDFNPASERTFGYGAANVIGREMAELMVPPSARDMHRSGLARHMTTGESRLLDRRVEVLGMRSDGSEFPVELTITRIHGSDTAMFAGHLRDITDRKAAERELLESRARVVVAADAERRRVQRDLHDGAQQRLIALGVTLARARRGLDGSADHARALLDEATADLARAVAELRDLSRGIHPTVLTDLGLAAAVAELARRSQVAMTVDIPAQRLPYDIEATAYFVIAESLTNVTKYAQATRVEVRAHLVDGTLIVEVRDDGVGGADPAAGSGLLGLLDRVRAADGELTVDSPPQQGTQVRAVIPLPATDS